MAGIKIDNFSTSDVNLTEIMTTLQALRQGHFKLSLTEMDTTVIPKIAAGSIIDINGSLVYFDADESISGTASDGVSYIKLIYSSGVITAEWTNISPVFDTSQNGWYGTGGSSGHRYICKMMKAATSYSGKFLLDTSNLPYIYETQTQISAGAWTPGTTRTLTFTLSSMTTTISIITIEQNGLVGATGNSAVSLESVTFSTNTITFIFRSNSNASASTDFVSATLTAVGY